MKRRQKMIQVFFRHQEDELEKEWTIHVPAKSEMLAIVVACKCFVSDGFDLDDVIDVSTMRSYSYL
ncbi:hypothetical protein [Cohnella lupini]|jgi:hypothetical protein|uniref:Uncharacterized protein n=1 Tax=Cohnella lupini TaxID=1294267 RepID=A0A3D9I3B0_9BACL|nr:hypothetical protein [Cohnella lupini]RED56263.1 hypothetical protein DFP95_11437 [Cohnella lupini]